VSNFGNALFSGSRFIFWSLGPILLLGGLAFIGLAIWAFPDAGANTRVGLALFGLFSLIGVPVLYDPVRFKPLSRFMTGTVFAVYVWYLISEWTRHAGDTGTDRPGGLASPTNAVFGLVIIGLPCLWCTLLGRFSLREPAVVDHSTSGQPPVGE